MTPHDLIAAFDTISEAPDGVTRLRELVLQLAVRGRLVPQTLEDEPATELVGELELSKERLLAEKIIGKPRHPCGVPVVQHPFEIPATWHWFRLGDVGAIVGGGTPKSGEPSFWSDGEDIPWLTPADMRRQRTRYISRGNRDITAKGLKGSSAQMLPKGSVLFSSRAPIGHVGIAANPLSTNQGFKSSVPYIADMSEYLHLFLKHAGPEINEEASGTTFKEVSGKEVALIPVPVPPVAEQHRIVAKVDELMGLLDRLEAARRSREAARTASRDSALAALHDADTPEEVEVAWTRIADRMGNLFTTPADVPPLQEAVRQLAVRGRLVRQNSGHEPASAVLGRVREDEACLVREKRIRKRKGLPPVDADEAPFDLPIGWVWTRVEDAAQPDQTVTYGILKPIWVESGVRTVRVTEMKTGTIDVAVLPQCEPTRAAKFEKTTLSSGDLLISKDGTIGKTAFVPPELAGGNITQHVLRFPISHHLDRRFVRLCIDAPVCQAWMTGETKGVALQGVNVGDFRRMPLPVPPRAEQEQIVLKFEEIARLLDDLERHLLAKQTALDDFAAAAVHHLDI